MNVPGGGQQSLMYSVSWAFGTSDVNMALAGSSKHSIEWRLIQSWDSL